MSETRRGRGRPKGSGVIARNDITAAALDALAAGGYTGLSMRGIARSLDVSLGAIQHHFATKDDLWQAAIDDFSDSMQRYVSETARPDIAEAIEAVLDYGSARPGLLTALLSDRAPGCEDRISYVAGRLTARTSESLALVERRSTDGHMRTIDARALLMLLGVGIGSIAGSADAMRAVYGCDLDDPSERSALAGGLADIVTRGVLPR